MKYGHTCITKYKDGQNLMDHSGNYVFPEPVTLYDHHAVGKVFVYWYRHFDMAGLMWERFGESSVVKPIYADERMFIYEAGGGTHVKCDSPFTVTGHIIAIDRNDLFLYKDGRVFVRSIKGDEGVIDSKNVIIRSDMSIVIDNDRIHIRKGDHFITMKVHELSGIKAFDTNHLITYIDTYKWDVIVEEYLENKRRTIQ